MVSMVSMVSASKRSRWVRFEILMKNTTSLALTRTAHRYLPPSTSAASAGVEILQWSSCVLIGQISAVPFFLIAISDLIKRDIVLPLAAGFREMSVNPLSLDDMNM